MVMKINMQKPNWNRKSKIQNEIDLKKASLSLNSIKKVMKCMYGKIYLNFKFQVKFSNELNICPQFLVKSIDIEIFNLIFCWVYNGYS